MSNDWSEVKLGDVLVLQRGFDLPEKDRRFGAYPVVASTGTVGMHDKAMAQGPGVVIGRSGSLGGGQFIENDFWPLNTTLWVKDFKENHRRFCYYLLKSLNFSQFNVGSGVPTLNRNHIHPILVRLPPIRDPRNLGRQDRVKPPNERDVGGDGACDVQGVVCGFRASACEDGGALEAG